jgi:uncharacterized protein YndB with AHSA1/START domain
MLEPQFTIPEGTQQIDVTKEVDAPRDVVFRAFTEPELLAQWLGPRRLTMEVDQYEVRNGGTWRYIHRDADGTGFGFHGVFHGDPSPDQMIQTFEFEGAPGHVQLDTLRLDELEGGRTRIRMSSVFQTVAGRDAMVASGMREGLTEGFERLDELVGRLVPVG